GVVRSADPKRTFERDDGTEGKVRNVRVQDETDDIRVALWGEKADLDLGPGDEVLFVDVGIQDGWQDDIEASANWRSTVIPLEEGATAEAVEDGEGDTGLDAFGDAGGSKGDDTEAATPDRKEAADAPVGTAQVPSLGEEGEAIEFTGVVVQSGDPIILDDGEKTVTVETSADVELGQEVTVSGVLHDGRLEADEVR
ncbi:MAG: replication factor A, partial [Halodesulfurarchaeum sp.]